jgi:toluene monooxygenase system protein B
MTETQETGTPAPQPPEAEGQPVPVNAMFEGDFVTQLVLVLDTDTVDAAAHKVAAQVVGRRVAPRDAGLAVRHDGKAVPGDLTVAQAGIAPLDVVFVGWAG